MWEGTQKAIDAYNQNMSLIDSDKVIDAINNNNRELAKELCEAYQLVDPKYLN